MAPTPDGIRVTPENAQIKLQRDELKNYTKEELMILAERKAEEVTPDNEGSPIQNEGESSILDMVPPFSLFSRFTDAFNDKNIEKSDSKESKEKFVKSLEFAPDTFRLDSTDWIEATKENSKDHPEIEKFIDKGVKVKVNATGDVVEYLEYIVINGELMCAKGEQIFIFDYDVKSERDRFFGYIATAKGCPIEEVESRYFMTEDELREKMKDKPDNLEEYKKFFEQEVRGHLAGCWNPHDKRFCNIGDGSNMWLAGGDSAYFSFNDTWIRDDDNRNYGCSIRLLNN